MLLQSFSTNENAPLETAAALFFKWQHPGGDERGPAILRALIATLLRYSLLKIKILVRHRVRPRICNFKAMSLPLKILKKLAPSVVQASVGTLLLYFIGINQLFEAYLSSFMTSAVFFLIAVWFPCFNALCFVIFACILLICLLQVPSWFFPCYAWFVLVYLLTKPHPSRARIDSRETFSLVFEAAPHL